MNTFRFLKTVFFLLVIFSGALLFNAQFAYADIQIIPPYVTFDSKQRSADLMVINTADAPATFKLYLYNMKQTETGGYQKIDKPLNPVFDPAQVIVFSPKQVRLPARGKQKVRLSLKRPENLPDGEYRAHLKLERISAPAAETKAEPGQIVTDITINISFSVPVVVRQGASDATAKIGDVKLIPATGKSQALMEVTVERAGKFGTMGGLRVFWTAPGQEEKQIGIMNGFNIYPESAHRIGKLALNTSEIKGGTLRVEYIGAAVDAGKVFDEKIIPVGG